MCSHDWGKKNILGNLKNESPGVIKDININFALGISIFPNK